MTSTLAISTSYRADPRVKELVTLSQRGEKAPPEELSTIFLENVTDDDARSMLDRSRKVTDADAPVDLYESFLTRLDILKRDHLFPQRFAGDTFAKAETEWAALEEDIRIASERLWRDDFLTYQTDKNVHEEFRRLPRRKQRNVQESPQVKRLRQLTRQAHLLRLLWLEVVFFRLRMTSNYKFRQEFGSALDTNQAILNEMTNTIHLYRATLKEWDKELRKIVGRRFFHTQLGDAERFKSLKKTFGFTGVGEAELGWRKDATEAGELLRSEYYYTLMRESLQVPRRWLQALWLIIFGLTSGYGARPLRFAGTTLVAILVFTTAFFISDLNANGACQAYRVPASLPDRIVSFLHHFYVGITNLTSLGSNPTPCGPGAPILLTLSSLFGYFLLATLAALFIEQLVESDQ